MITRPQAKGRREGRASASGGCRQGGLGPACRESLTQSSAWSLVGCGAMGTGRALQTPPAHPSPQEQGDRPPHKKRGWQERRRDLIHPNSLWVKLARGNGASSKKGPPGTRDARSSGSREGDRTPLSGCGDVGPGSAQGGAEGMEMCGLETEDVLKKNTLRLKSLCFPQPDKPPRQKTVNQGHCCWYPPAHHRHFLGPTWTNPAS